METKENHLQLNVKPIRQDKAYNCGSTALLIAIKHQFGLRLTQRDVDLLTSVTEDGVSEYNLIAALDVLGIKYYQTNNGTLNDLRACLQQGQAPIVHIVVKDGEGHYVVVVGMDEEHVQLVDPSVGKTVTYGIPFFTGVWKVQERETSTPWYMVLTGRGVDKFDAVIEKYKRVRNKLRKAGK